MKKLAILAVLATLVLGLAATASAVDLTAKGKFQFQMNLMDNSDFLSAKHNGQKEDDLNFYFRARTQFRFIANENLMAELYTQYKSRLGNGNVNTDGGSTGSALTVKRAFLQYRFPGTEVLTTAGIFSINLPGAAAGSMVLGDLDAGAIAVNTPITEQFGVTVGFVRAHDNNSVDAGYGTSAVSYKDEIDLFYAALPITIDGIEASPYFMYGLIGRDSGEALNSGLTNVAMGATPTLNKDANAWWLGTSFSMNMFDPIVFDADIVYGSLDANQKVNDRAGLLVDASLAYTGLDFVQPKLMFAYTTGDDDNTSNGSERLPSVNNDWAMGTTYFGGSALTSADLNDQQQVGFWTIGLGLEDISFLDKLSHDIYVLYARGTNDKDVIKNSGLTGTCTGNYLTTEDQMFEVDFNTNYQIYDELAAIVEFGYVYVDLDKNVWENFDANRAGKDDPMLKFAVGLVYSF